MTQRKGFLPAIFIGGLLFGFGLGYSQMTRPEVVLDFLQWDDFGLLFVMGGAGLVTGLVFHLATRSKRKAPLTDKTYGLRQKSLDRDVVTGGIIFGVGWGISGMCPGAAYASIGLGNFPILIGIAGMFIGTYVLRWWQSRKAAVQLTST